MTDKCGLKKAVELIDKYKMLDGAKKVLCAVSGGADSMCLLVFLSEILPERGIEFAAAHFNHKLRGDESDRDERFVRDFCQSKEIELAVGSADVALYAKENGMSVEEASRDARYEFLETTASELGAQRIATAHNSDDQLETILMNLARGSGTRGLAGIPPVRDRFIRPLLAVSREEILAFLASRGVSHVEDSTNKLDDATRNEVRHKVVPALKNIFPYISDNAFRASTLVRADAEYLDRVAWEKLAECPRENGEIVLNAEELSAVPAPVSSRLVMLAAKSLGAGLSEAHVQSVLKLAGSDQPSASVSLPGGLLAYRNYSELRISSVAPSVRTFPDTEPDPGRWTEIKELGLAFGLFDTPDEAKINGAFNIFLFKKEAVCGRIHVRPRKTGDSLKLSARGCRKTLKKLFIEKKIPLSERELVYVAADDSGVLCVEGFGTDVRAACGKLDEAVVLAVKNI